MLKLKTISLLGHRSELDALPEGKLLINTINAHSYNTALKDPAFAEALLRGDALIPDGASIVLAFKLLRHEKIERTAGWDLFLYEMDKLNRKGGTCFFLGSSEDTLRKIKVKAVRLYPNIRVETYSPPYKPEFTQEDNQAMIAAVNRAQPDLLWVGMTAPKQEKWTYAHLKELEVNGPIGTIGAVFDFFAENVQRAPVWWQEHGLEWLYRLIKEPKRMWRRYIIGNCLFLWNITIKTDFKTRIMDKKIALISGITGQDGSFLAEFLIEKGYEVHGILRRSSSFNTGRIEHLYLDEWVRDMKKNRLVNLHYGDMTDSSSLIRIIQQVQPDEIYNLAAQSHVKVSFDVSEYTAEADAVGTLRMLEAVRILGLEKKTKIYQASTSELFGLVQEVPQKETTPFYPRSPYGVAKQYGFWITKNYRESYGMLAVNGILFNHESERRGETFVTRKITLAAARIAQGYQDKLYLGNLNSLRDWGYAKDYVECMWLILQHDTPEDFVIATGEYHTVRDFTTLAFKETGVELRWEGEGVNEKGIDTKTGKVLVEVDPKYFRPAEVEQLLGDPTKARTLLGWNPRKTSFEELVKIMVTHDMAFVKRLYMRAQMNGKNTSQTC